MKNGLHANPLKAPAATQLDIEWETERRLRQAIHQVAADAQRLGIDHPFKAIEQGFFVNSLLPGNRAPDLPDYETTPNDLGQAYNAARSWIQQAIAINAIEEFGNNLNKLISSEQIIDLRIQISQKIGKLKSVSEKRLLPKINRYLGLAQHLYDLEWALDLLTPTVSLVSANDAIEACQTAGKVLELNNGVTRLCEGSYSLIESLATHLQNTSSSSEQFTGPLAKTMLQSGLEKLGPKPVAHLLLVSSITATCDVAPQLPDGVYNKIRSFAKQLNANLDIDRREENLEQIIDSEALNDYIQTGIIFESMSKGKPVKNSFRRCMRCVASNKRGAIEVAISTLNSFAKRVNAGSIASVCTRIESAFKSARSQTANEPQLTTPEILLLSDPDFQNTLCELLACLVGATSELSTYSSNVLVALAANNVIIKPETNPIPTSAATDLHVLASQDEGPSELHQQVYIVKFPGRSEDIILNCLVVPHKKINSTAFRFLLNWPRLIDQERTVVNLAAEILNQANNASSRDELPTLLKLLRVTEKIDSSYAKIAHDDLQRQLSETYPGFELIKAANETSLAWREDRDGFSHLDAAQWGAKWNAGEYSPCSWITVGREIPQSIRRLLLEGESAFLRSSFSEYLQFSPSDISIFRDRFQEWLLTKDGLDWWMSLGADDPELLKQWILRNDDHTMQLLAELRTDGSDHARTLTRRLLGDEAGASAQAERSLLELLKRREWLRINRYKLLQCLGHEIGIEILPNFTVDSACDCRELENLSCELSYEFRDDDTRSVQIVSPQIKRRSDGSIIRECIAVACIGAMPAGLVELRRGLTQLRQTLSSTIASDVDSLLKLLGDELAKASYQGAVQLESHLVDFFKQFYDVIVQVESSPSPIAAQAEADCELLDSLEEALGSMLKSLAGFKVHEPPETLEGNWDKLVALSDADKTEFRKHPHKNRITVLRPGLMDANNNLRLKAMAELIK